MTTQGTLPRLEDCVGLYRRAYDRHGTGSFTAEQLDGGSDTETRRLLELAVAYGLLGFDGATYRIRCAPDATGDCWRTAARERADAIRRAVSDGTDGDDSGAVGGDGRSTLSRDGRTFASVYVAESDDFEAVARSIAGLQRGDGTGVVLRSPGDRADEVQRIADRLCDASAVIETPVAEPFQKEFTDVVGDDKDALEFRLFLGGP